MKILIMGLPGSGKSTLAREIKKKLVAQCKSVEWLNADEIRQKFNDWDFSHAGRIRQSNRMREIAESIENVDFVICDFVAPLPEMRNNFKADFTIWVDTIEQCRFEDTNKMFSPPEVYDFRVTEQNAPKWSKFIALEILNQVKK